MRNFFARCLILGALSVSIAFASRADKATYQYPPPPSLEHVLEFHIRAVVTYWCPPADSQAPGYAQVPNDRLTPQLPFGLIRLAHFARSSC